MNFNFYSPSEIHFGTGSFDHIGKIAKKYGNRAFVIISSKLVDCFVTDKLQLSFESNDIDYKIFTTSGKEPTCEGIDSGVLIAKSYNPDFIVGIGGGSVLDTAKAIAGLCPNEGNIIEYLEGVGTGRQLTVSPLPFIAVPTTSGTGAEVTKNAVISGTGFKKSFRDSRLFAKAVIADPLLTVSMPKSVTAESGMDAITQLIESYTTKKSNPLTDGLCLSGIRLAKSLPKCHENGEDIKSRENMSAAALISGICLANSGLGAVHGIAASLGSNLGVSHGKACSILLPHIIKLNSSVCEKKYREIAEVFCGKSEIETLINVITEMNEEFNIPKDLKSYTINDSLLQKIVEDSFGSSMSGNALQLSSFEWSEFLKPLV